MLFRQLEYFVALAQERHFARAASACYVSQPALSEAIRKLESELNVPLVRRGQKFEGLTPEGERLVPWARRILADRDALKQEVTALQAGLTGELRLGVVPAASTTVALLTDPFCAAHPLVRIQDARVQFEPADAFHDAGRAQVDLELNPDQRMRRAERIRQQRNGSRRGRHHP
ncbi:LysR family transcriptional regulator, partial [Mycobacterium sp. 1245801.1]|uniref:LysR family transcriptional regulator n=1 Tax=Mycobacterium sp. 1245801.1 TaxID=1834075 RepID=UPI000B2822D9